jgi:hypothetical protein
VGDDSVRTSLSDDELLTTAFVAQAVSPVTSFLAVPREAALSTIGVELMGGVGGLGDGLAEKRKGGDRCADERAGI